MKCIIAGSRSITDYKILQDEVKKSGFDITEIVSGNASGVDKLGEQYAREHKILLKVMPAKWGKHGRSAGHIRNREMAEYVGKEGGLILIYDGKSPGSTSMLNIAKSLGLKIHVRIVDAKSTST